MTTPNLDSAPAARTTNHGLPVPALLIGLAALTLLLFVSVSDLKPLEKWRWLDILAEGGTALMAGVWAGWILACRPVGRVTWLLAGGLTLVMLGAWLDCLDEFFKLAASEHWAKPLESGLTLFGMLLLTAGLWFWRDEQFSLTELLHKRERIFREHRGFDRITQLADAAYLRKQIELERARRPHLPCALVLLDVENFHRVGRLHGPAESNRLLQSLSHLLLLNLRNDDLLCRYAGDRFAVLLPETSAQQAQEMGAHLATVIGTLAQYTRIGGQRIEVSARVVCALASNDAETLLAGLNRAIDEQVPAVPRQGSAPIPTIVQ